MVTPRRGDLERPPSPLLASHISEIGLVGRRVGLETQIDMGPGQSFPEGVHRVAQASNGSGSFSDTEYRDAGILGGDEHTGLTEDHRDAARAFVEKRAPVFNGR